MKKLIYIMVLVFLLAGCASFGRQVEFNQYEGQNGVVPVFSSNSPPERVYENTPFPVRIQLHNMGAVEVLYKDLMITFSGDPLYIEIPPDIRQYEPTVFDKEDDRILGRSLSYPEGEKKSFRVPAEYAFYAKPIYGTRERPETELTVSACYRYNTVATTPVCIDTNAYYENEREQPCVQQPITFSGGQGAPIAVTRVEVESFPVVDRLLGTDSVRPHFTIHLRDVADGRLIGPDHLAMETACLLKSIDDLDFNAVKIRAWLLNTELECQPGDQIKLLNGEGVARCTVPSNDLSNPVYASKQNFQSNLIINVSYLYKSSETISLDVNRIPGTDRGDSIRLDELSSYGKETGILYSGDEPVVDDAGNVYTECRYYAENPDKAPPEINGLINSDYSCGCSREVCLTLSKSGKCLFGGYCRPGTYCCDKTRETVGQNKVAEIALQEHEFFGGKSECTPEVAGRVSQYFSAGGCSGTCGGTAWSAGFISYVMGKSGIDFPRSCNHWKYFTDVRSGVGSCKTLKTSEVGKLKVGDLVCNCRGGSCPIQYSDPYRNGVESHCDVITNIDGDSYEIVGGNVGDTVQKRTVSKSQLQASNYYGYISC